MSTRRGPALRHGILARFIIAAVAALGLAMALLGQDLSPGLAAGTAAVVVALAIGGYEGLAYGLAWLLSRLPGSLPPGPVPGPTAAAPVAPALRRFGVRHGVAALAWYLGMQFLVWVVAGLRAGLAGPPDEIQQAMVRVAPVALPLSLALAALTLVFQLRYYQRRSDWGALRASIGLTWGPRRDRLGALAAGAAVAVLYLVGGPLLADPTGVEPGFLASLASDERTRLAWVVSAAVMAGPAEEILFRGVLLHALRTAVSLPVAALSAGFIFWLLHLSEMRVFWPSAVAIGLLAALTTLLRLHTRSLGPSILMHVGYNSALAVLVLAA